MTPKEFVAAYKAFATATFNKTGILPEVILAQAALESGWGKHAPGNMFFGVKDFDGVNGNEQLVTTFEYNRKADLSPKQIGLETIESVTPVTIANEKFFKYTGKAWFRKYNSPEESFTDHANVFLRVKRYAPALLVKDDAEKFVRLIAPIYAQSPTYADVVLSLVKQIKVLLK
jgi:flagellum-specific peptidoglycan hydrolase FlgJ